MLLNSRKSTDPVTSTQCGMWHVANIVVIMYGPMVMIPQMRMNRGEAASAYAKVMLFSPSQLFFSTACSLRTFYRYISLLSQLSLLLL